MAANFKLTIEYDGSNYHGWQRQKNDRTIQGVIEMALQTMTRKQIVLIGSGRTDAGVHAMGQVANFSVETRLKAENFQRGLNSLLPEDIVIKVCKQVDQKFHARYDVKSKTYQYKIINREIPSAIGRQYAWFIPKQLDLEAMGHAIRYFIGSHDFKAFEGAGSPRSNTTRHVLNADLKEEKHGYLVFEIEADGFLRFMVRNIIGTLVDVGLLKLMPDDFKKILHSKDRDQAGLTAPPHGLFLMEVKY
jgi:tRNA pseudouridine38-40 synthase